jgi:hypothetical protein
MCDLGVFRNESKALELVSSFRKYKGVVRILEGAQIVF